MTDGPDKPKPAQGARRRTRRRVTIRDVAEDAGVSFAAVSKVLRNAYGVSDGLREKVNLSIDRLGYRPNTAARGMSGGRTFVLGTIFPDFRNPFFSDVEAGISSALERTPYQACLGIVSHSNERALVQSMIDMQMDGLIIVGSVTEGSVLEDVGDSIPLVTLGHHLPGARNFDTVNNNDRQSAAIAIDHLVAAGKNRIMMFSLDIHNGTVISEREAGYAAQMEAAGLGAAVEIVRVSQSLRDIQVEAKRVLERKDRPDAVFCWTDYVALEVMSVAESIGLAVPGELAIVGHDNTLYCDLHQNRLTSIDQSGEQLGLQAARLLVERIEGRSGSQHFLVQPRLVVRASSGG